MHPLSGVTWYVLHSGRAIWSQKRNAHAAFSQSEILLYTYQAEESSEIMTREEHQWKEMASGKVGRLESWMKETSMGIEDDSGEVRADWRSSWVAVTVSSTDNLARGIDVLFSRNEKPSDEELEDIRRVIFAKSPESVIFRVLNDGSRDEEVKREEAKKRLEWERRTGKEAGISPDLTYDDEEEEKSSNCMIQ